MQLRILGGGSLLQAEYRKEGMLNYMVLPVNEEAVGNYESMLMQYHSVSYIVPYEIRQVNGICELYYRLQYRTTLRAVMGHLPFNMKRLMHMTESIVGVLESAEEYFFNADNILWHPDFIFIEADTGKLLFCSYPDGNDSGMSLQKLLSELMQQVDKKDEPAVMYLLQFYNLVTEPVFSLAGLRAFLLKNRPEMELSPAYMPDKNAMPEQQKFQKAFPYMEELPERELLPEPQQEQTSTYNTYDFIKPKTVPSEYTNRQEAVTGNKEKTPAKSTGENAVKWILMITALVNLLLIAMLLFNILTYDYVRYLIGTMGAMIILTIIYMNISKEETPDEMMQAFFEENAVPPTDKVESQMAYAGVTNGYSLYTPNMEREANERTAPEEYTPVNNNVHLYGADNDTLETAKPAQQYGETVLLTAEGGISDSQTMIAEELTETSLYLESFIKGQYPPIYIEHSIIIGCMEEGCGYLLKQRGVSRMHTKLMNKPDGLYVLDLNSTNGTFLNGEILAGGEEYKLQEGDMIAFAQCEFYVARGNR